MDFLELNKIIIAALKTSKVHTLKFVSVTSTCLFAFKAKMLEGIVNTIVV